MKLFFIVVLFPIFIFSQEKISGIIIDGITNKPLPFATVTTNTNFVLLADMDGKFSLNLTSLMNEFKISYVGYSHKTIPITDTFIKIKLFV